MKLPDEIKKKQFLVVDDYESMRLLMSNSLGQLGIEKVIYASSGNKALGIVKEKYGTPEQIDFIMTDMMMDDGSGVDLTRGVRAEEKFKTVPILMVSSIDEVAKMLEAVKAGITDYIVKPWDDETLSKKIANCLLKVTKK